MNIVYVSKANDVDEMITNFGKKLPLCIKRRLAKNKVILNKQGENIECKAFFYDKLKDKELQKIGQKMKQIILANEYKNIVVSNALKKRLSVYNELKGLNILNGRWLFNYLIYDVINYILDKKRAKITESEISILVNQTTDTNIQNILKIAQNVKILNIVTDNIAIFKQIEEKLYNDMGIMVRVTNNKRKSLLKSDIIINLDFDEENFNKYNVPNKRNYCKCK